MLPYPRTPRSMEAIVLNPSAETRQFPVGSSAQTTLRTPEAPQVMPVNSTVFGRDGPRGVATAYSRGFAPVNGGPPVAHSGTVARTMCEPTHRYSEPHVGPSQLMVPSDTNQVHFRGHFTAERTQCSIEMYAEPQLTNRQISYLPTTDRSVGILPPTTSISRPDISPSSIALPQQPPVSSPTETGAATCLRPSYKRMGGKFVCMHPGCGKEFAHSSSCRRHRYCHMGLKPWVCQLCQRQFSQRRYLVGHSKTHSKALHPYVCSLRVCGQSFKDRSELYHHEYSHIMGGLESSGVADNDEYNTSETMDNATERVSSQNFRTSRRKVFYGDRSPKVIAPTIACSPNNTI